MWLFCHFLCKFAPRFMCTHPKTPSNIMKKILSILIILALLPLTSRAQVGEQKHDLCLGINGGIALNKVGFTPKINQTYHMGPTAGITMRYTSERYLGMYCAFQAELNYSSLGWKEDIYSSTNEKLPDTYQRNLTYIQMPIMAHLSFGKYTKGFRGHFIAGPQFGYLIGDVEKQSEIWTTMSSGRPDRMNSITSQYGLKAENSFEYGITAGLGGELTTSLGHFILEGRYYMGLSNVFNNSKKDPFPKSNNSTIMIKVTYLIDVTH